MHVLADVFGKAIVTSSKDLGLPGILPNTKTEMCAFKLHPLLLSFRDIKKVG